MNANKLGNDFAKWAREIVLPDRCRLHGLKKRDTRRRAERGYTTQELMALGRYKTLTGVSAALMPPTKAAPPVFPMRGRSLVGAQELMDIVPRLDLRVIRLLASGPES